MKNAKKAKPVPYRFIVPDSVEGRPVYDRLHRILDTYHDDVAGARFALAWKVNWTPDPDGHLTLGQCRKVGDLDREIVDQYDFVIVLNQKWWNDPLITNGQRDALLDHECCHAGVKVDADGEPVIDERGRVVYRMVRHDVEDFIGAIERNGCYKKDLEQFARAIERARQKADDQWVGYTSLQEDLKQAGLTVSVDQIVTWSDAERREARTWALLRQEHIPELWRQAIPTFLSAVRPEL